MDTSRQNSAEEQKNSRMTSNPANTYENSYHQKPPSFNHKQVNISLVDDGSNNPKKQKTNKNEKQESGSNEWRESIPIKLEHFLFNFKENSLKVYKAPKIMLISAILACLLFCGVLALILSQRDDLKKEANLPLDQSAIAERIIGESLLNHHKLKNSLFEQKNQTGLGEKSRKNYHSAKSNDASAKDAAVRKAFGSLLFSGDDNDEIEPDPEENNSDESFDGERSRSRTNFNLFLSDNERQNTADEQKEKSPAINEQQNENPRVMFIERLMGFGMQPKFGLSESLVIRKTIGGDENISTTDDQTPSSNKIKESKIKSEEDPTFLLKYAAAAMLSRILATAQQQAYIQQVQQQQRFREINEKNIFSNHPPYYRGYRMMREPAESALMYGRPMHQPHKPHYHPQSRLLPPFQTPQGQFVSSDRGFSRGPLLSNEEAESQQAHPIILMLNIPYKDQTPASAHLMGQGQAAAFAQPTIETSIQPIFMPYAPNSPLPRQNPYYKPTRDQQHPVYSPPFAHHKNHNYYPQQSANEGYYTHPYNSIPMNRGSANGPVSPPQQRYNHRMANTIEVPIEIHQVSPPILPSQSHNHAAIHQPTAQIIVQPQLESAPQPNENEQDQPNENEHHMVVFYDSSDNMSHSEENNSNNIPPTFKENKPLNNNLEKANQQMGKMLLLHFVNPNNNVAPPSINQQPQIVDSMPPEQQSPQLRKPFLIQQEQPIIEKQQQPINNQDNQNKQKPEIIKNEEETSSTNDQINREEVFEKTTVSDNQNESENEPASLAHFAQVIRHVIDQQHQNQEQQRPPQQIQPVIAQPKPVSSVSQQSPQQSPQNQQTSTSPTIQQFNQSRKEIQTENSNKEISQVEKSESIQESIQSPAFAMLVENDEN